MAADVPENYMRYADAFRFIKDVAVDWDESRYLAAEPGEYIIAARREKGGQRWFVGGVTNEDARTMTVDFSFLTKGQKYMATIYADAKDADYEINPEKYVISRRVVTAKDKAEIEKTQITTPNPCQAPLPLFGKGAFLCRFICRRANYNVILERQ